MDEGPHDDINQLLNLLGLWLAYYCDKTIGHAKEWVQLAVERIMVTS